MRWELPQLLVLPDRRSADQSRTPSPEPKAQPMSNPKPELNAGTPDQSRIQNPKQKTNGGLRGERERSTRNVRWRSSFPKPPTATLCLVSRAFLERCNQQFPDTSNKLTKAHLQIPNPKFRIPSQKNPTPQIEITNQNPTHNPKSKSETEPESGWKTQSKPNQHQDINQSKKTNPTYNSNNPNNMDKHPNAKTHIPDRNYKCRSTPEAESQIGIQVQVNTIIKWQHHKTNKTHKPKPA